jgi:hypothetical protein
MFYAIRAREDFEGLPVKSFSIWAKLCLGLRRMSLFFATLLTGIVVAGLGALLLSGHSAVSSVLRGFPRSQGATVLLFGAASAWFLYRVWNLSMADFGEFRTMLFVFFAAVALLSFYYVPDFLAVRGLAGLLLLAALPLLDAAYMHYELPQRLLLVGFVYLCIFLALWLGAQPYRMRDFLEWLYRQPARPRALGGALLAYGLALCAVAATC